MSIAYIQLFIHPVPELEVELAGGPALPNGSGDLRAVVKEGDGVLDRLIRIYSPGIHVIDLVYHVSITPSSERALANKLLLTLYLLVAATNFSKAPYLITAV